MRRTLICLSYVLGAAALALGLWSMILPGEVFVAEIAELKWHDGILVCIEFHRPHRDGDYASIYDVPLFVIAGMAGVAVMTFKWAQRREDRNRRGFDVVPDGEKPSRPD